MLPENLPEITHISIWTIKSSRVIFQCSQIYTNLQEILTYNYTFMGYVMFKQYITILWAFASLSLANALLDKAGSQ